MEMTKVVKPFIKRGWPNTFGNIVYVGKREKERYRKTVRNKEEKDSVRFLSVIQADNLF